MSRCKIVGLCSVFPNSKIGAYLTQIGTVKIATIPGKDKAWRVNLIAILGSSQIDTVYEWSLFPNSYKKNSVGENSLTSTRMVYQTYIS